MLRRVARNDVVASIGREILSWRLSGCLRDKVAGTVGERRKWKEGEEVARCCSVRALFKLVLDIERMGPCN